MRIDILGPTGSGKGIMERILYRALTDLGIKIEQGPNEHSMDVCATPRELHKAHDAQRQEGATTVELERMRSLLQRAQRTLALGSMYSAAASGSLHTDTRKLADEIKLFIDETLR